MTSISRCTHTVEPAKPAVTEERIKLLLTQSDATALRDALHIATHLMANLPALITKTCGPLNAAAYSRLHYLLREAGVTINVGVLDFERQVVHMRTHLPTTPVMFAKLEEKRYKFPPALRCPVTPLVQEPKPLWKVQWLDRVADYWCDYTRATTTTGAPDGLPLVDIPSRNEAYRRMRARITSITSSRFPTAPILRAVPNNTPQGKEKDRGYYVVQYMSGVGEWRNVSLCTSSGFFPGVKYATVEKAMEYERTPTDTYRIKWCPNGEDLPKL